MKKTTLLCSTLLAGLLPVTATHAQDYWNPFGSFEGTLNFDYSTGQLRIPALTVRANQFEPSTLLYDVVLIHEGDEHFRVVSSRSVQPDEECTRAEVTAAVTQLHLDMTVEEAEALIGCKAVISPQETDMELGRRVEVSWVGRDGVANQGVNGYRPFFVVSSTPSTWVPASGTTTPSGVPFLGSSSGGPAIVFSLREGVLESYTYTERVASTLCESAALAVGFPTLEEGDSRAEIEAKLDCPGTLLATTVSEGQISEQVVWQSRSSPILASIPAELDSHNIEVTLVNDALALTTKTSSTVQHLPSPCSVDEIVFMADAIQLGMSESAMLAVSTCATSYANSNETNSSRTASYHWSSQLTPDSVYVSVNRSLTVLVQEGVVRAVNLRRQ